MFFLGLGIGIIGGAALMGGAAYLAARAIGSKIFEP